MRLHMDSGEVEEVDVVVGADGIDSLVRRTLWGDQPKREHNLHIFGGYTFDKPAGAEPDFASSRIAAPSRAAGPPSATTVRTDSSGGCSARWDAGQEFTGRPEEDGHGHGRGFPRAASRS